MEAGVCSLSDDVRRSFESAAKSMAEDGLRVLALAWRKNVDAGNPADLESAMTLAGLVGFEEPPKPSPR
jgi:sodium/potassium-transporting ATPase subunit alpha